MIHDSLEGLETGLHGGVLPLVQYASPNHCVAIIVLLYYYCIVIV